MLDIFKASDLDENGILGFNELKTLYRLLCNQHSGDFNQQMQDIRNLYNEYAEMHSTPKDSIKVKGINYDAFERLCVEKDIFTIRQQNSFINAATRTFLNVTDSNDTFSKEFEKLSANMDSIYNRLSGAISEIMDSAVVPD